MANNLQFDFLINREKLSVTIIREFAADLNLVWDAWTKPEILDQWWAPKPWKSKTKSMRFEEGGQRLYAMCGPDGEEHWGITSFTTVVEHDHYAGIDSFSDAEGVINEEMPEATFTISFSKKGAHTLVTNKTIYPSLAQLEATLEMGMKEGITVAMQGLDAVLENLKAKKMSTVPFYMERIFDTDPKTLWRALTEKDLLKQWCFDMDDFTPEVGFCFTFNGESKDCVQYTHLCEVTEVIPEKKLSYSWRYQGYSGISHLTFELIEMGDKTKLQLTHTGLNSFPASNPDFAPQNFAAGWDHIINTSLVNYLNTLN